MSVFGAEFPGELAQFTFISCDEETIDIQNFSIKFTTYFYDLSMCLSTTENYWGHVIHGVAYFFTCEYCFIMQLPFFKINVKLRFAYKILAEHKW